MRDIRAYPITCEEVELALIEGLALVEAKHAEETGSVSVLAFTHALFYVKQNSAALKAYLARAQ